MGKQELSPIEALMASAPPEAEIATEVKVDKVSEDKIIEVLKDFQPHASGVIAKALFGTQDNGSRTRMRELIAAMNQVTLEGKRSFPAPWVYHVAHGVFQLKKAKDLKTAEAFASKEYKAPVRNQK